MLSPIDEATSGAAQTTGSSPQPDKQICATGSGANTLVYTVPTGRKFVGWASNSSWVNGSYWTQLEVGGVAVYHYNGFSAQISQQYDGPDSVVLTLLGGTNVKVGNGGNVYVFGVESDA